MINEHARGRDITCIKLSWYVHGLHNIREKYNQFYYILIYTQIPISYRCIGMIWDISCEFAFIFSISKNDKNLNRHFTFVKCHIHMVNNAYSLVHLLVAYALIIFCLK